MNKVNKNKGFTLIELIVVITIIAVLTVVGIVSYTGTGKKSRDSRRMADLEQIRMALELYRQGTGSTYPADEDSLVPNYIQSIPKGPKGEDYVYVRASGYLYSIGTILEDLGSTNVNGFSGCSDCNYRVTNP